MGVKAFLARHRPKRKWLKIIWKKVRLGPWEIPWIDKAYVYGKRLHHLEIGLVLIFIGWILVIHDWLVYERPKLDEYYERERNKIIEKVLEEARERHNLIPVPKPGSKVGKLKGRFFKPRPAFEKRHWKETARPEEN